MTNRTAGTNGINIDSGVVARDTDSRSTGHTTTGEPGSKRPVVLITGDSLGLPIELGSLLSDCGCSAFATTDLEALKDRTQADPEVIIVNIANVQDADPESVQALQNEDRKPVVCLLPYPTEQQVARAAALGADVLIFKPLCAEEFKSRIRLLLWANREQTAFHAVDQDRRESFLQVKEWDRVVVRDGERLRLTRKEHALLTLLASNPGRVFSMAEIIRSVWPGARKAVVADVHQCVYTLRKKIEKDRHNPTYVVSAPSLGYRLAASAAGATPKTRR